MMQKIPFIFTGGFYWSFLGVLLTVNKKSMVYKQTKKHATKVLEGTVLCVDPSTGSKSSLPGYALYKKGKLVESGLIEVDLKTARQAKLYEINRTLREEFEQPDILVVEFIPSVRFKTRGNNMTRAAMASLHRAVGAIECAFPVPVIEVHPMSWARFRDENYVKTDEMDAIYIGICVMETAKHIIKAEGADE